MDVSLCSSTLYSGRRAPEFLLPTLEQVKHKMSHVKMWSNKFSCLLQNSLLITLLPGCSLLRRLRKALWRRDHYWQDWTLVWWCACESSYFVLTGLKVRPVTDLRSKKWEVVCVEPNVNLKCMYNGFKQMWKTVLIIVLICVEGTCIGSVKGCPVSTLSDHIYT